jgi:hypothetical protein
MSLFLENNKQPPAVEELMTELRVMLDKRRPASINNVIDFTQAADRSEDALFLEEYQALAGAVTRYFFKQGDELSYEDYYYLQQQIRELKSMVKQKESE